MQNIGKVKQYFMGATPVILLWVLATISQDEVLVTPIYDTLEATTFKNFDVVLYPIIPLISLGVILIWNFSSAIIGKKYDLNQMYYATLVSSIVPTVTFLLSFMFSDDSNILAWMFWLTIGLILIPFGCLANYCFEGASDFFFWYLNVDSYPEIFALILVAVTPVSLVFFKKCKSKTAVVSEESGIKN